MALHCNTSHSLANASACVFDATKRKRGACPYLSELGHCPTGARCSPMPPRQMAGLAGQHLSSFALGRVVQVICRWEMSVWAFWGVLGARTGKGQHCSWGCGLWGWAKLSAAFLCPSEFWGLLPVFGELQASESRQVWGMLAMPKGAIHGVSSSSQVLPWGTAGSAGRVEAGLPWGSCGKRWRPELLFLLFTNVCPHSLALPWQLQCLEPCSDTMVSKPVQGCAHTSCLVVVAVRTWSSFPLEPPTTAWGHHFCTLLWRGQRAELPWRAWKGTLGRGQWAHPVLPALDPLQSGKG